MRTQLVYVQVRCEHPEHPEEKVSRHAGCLATLGLTLHGMSHNSVKTETNAPSVTENLLTKALLKLLSSTGSTIETSTVRYHSCLNKSSLENLLCHSTLLSSMSCLRWFKQSTRIFTMEKSRTAPPVHGLLLQRQNLSSGWRA